MPKVKTISVDYSDFDEPVARIEQQLEYHLRLDGQGVARVDEKHVLKSDQFQEAIKWARDELGIEYNYLEYEPDLDDWIAELLTGKDIEQIERYGSEYNKALETYLRVAWTATEKANLPYGWHSWVAAYIAMDKSPTEAVIEPNITEKIEVIGMSADSLIIRFTKGIKAEEYRKAWKAFSDFLNQSSPYRPNIHLLKNQIYLDRRNGMKIADIADKYFPHETDRFASQDKVRKIIKRFK